MRINEWKAVGGVWVHRFNLIGTRAVVHQVYEPTGAPGRSYTHGSITTGPDGTWLGRIGTGDLPADLDALPARSDERYDAVKAWQAAEYDRAYAAILAAYPEAAEGRRDMGDIEVYARGE